jgi:hypothetical protein
MKRMLLMVALLPACGTTPDERKPTLEVVTFEVLKPSCGQVQCHSTTTAIRGYAFDTYDASKASLTDMLSGRFTPTNNDLYQVMHDSGDDRMPPDYPLEQQDVDLVDAWLTAGAPGAR